MKLSCGNEILEKKTPKPQRELLYYTGFIWIYLKKKIMLINIKNLYYYCQWKDENLFPHELVLRSTSTKALCDNQFTGCLILMCEKNDWDPLCSQNCVMFLLPVMPTHCLCSRNSFFLWNLGIIKSRFY